MARLTNAAALFGAAIFCHVPIRYRLACLLKLRKSILAGEFRSRFLLSTSQAQSRTVRPFLSSLKDPEVLLKGRRGRHRGTRRLETSAEIVQKAADRTEKVRRCGFCHKAGHNCRTCPELHPQSSTGKHEGHVANTDRHASQQPDAVADTAQDGDEEVDSEEGSTLGVVWCDILSSL
ncbi:hypothetical protein V1504DRAFT_457629 [Lipomyces starkeyi]